MKQGKVYSLWQLICSEAPQKILIPQIQRDYVQYRSGRVAENLDRFVSSLVNALVNNSEINLNFVYGNVERIFDIDSKTSYNAFCPIDGQQRLTTLYLLHYYVLNEADDLEKKSQLMGKLVYRTRKTTMDFFTALFEKNTVKFSKSNKKPRALIRESGWYTSLWDADPSVLSCLKVLDVLHEKLSDFDSPSLLAERLTSDTCPITFMKLELEQLDNPNELYIKMNSRGRQLTAFENFKSEMFRVVKDKTKFYNLPNDFKSKIDGDWLELIWNLCDESYTDIFYRDLLHTCFMNSLIATLHDNQKDCIEKLDSYMKRPASSYYIEEYVKCFNECTNSNFSESEILPNLITRFYYTMDCLHKLSLYSPKIYSDVKSKIFGIGSDKKGNKISNLEDYHDNYISHTLLQAVCVFANSNGAKAETKEVEFISKFEDWWRIAKNLITNTEIDDIHSFTSAIRELYSIKYSYFITKYLAVLNDTDDKYISLDSSLKSSQKKEEILKQKIINLGDINWTKAILNAESHEYFNAEINFALRITGIITPEDTKRIPFNEFSDNWNIIEEIFETAKTDNILMHRVLLAFGNYSQRISDYGDTNYLLTYYSYSEKHHNQDWRGFLRKDVSGIFKDLVFDYKKQKTRYTSFTDYANAVIKNSTMFSKDDLNYYLIKNEELFKYTSAFRIWVYDTEYRLLENSVRSDYVNYELFQIYSDATNGLDIELHNGSNTKTKCYLSYKGRDFIIENGYFCEKATKYPLSSKIDDMVDYLSKL